MTDLITDYLDILRHGDHRYTRHAESTLDTYGKILRRMERQLPCGLNAATTEELEDWIFVDGRAETTYSLYTTVARGYGTWLTDPADPRFDFNSAALLPKLQAQSIEEVVAVEEDHLVDILGRAAEPYIDLFYLGAFEGMRCIEIGRADSDWLTRKSMRIYGKGSRWRTVPTHPAIWDRFGGRRGPLVPAPRTRRHLSREQVAGWGNNHLKRTLGYRQYSMHGFRKRFATQVYEASGHDIMLVKELLGHALVSTTQRYIATNRDRKAAAVTALTAPISRAA